MKKQISRILLLSFVFVLGLVFFLKLRLEEAHTDNRSRDTYESLSLEELKESLKSKKKTFVYIRREDCPTCLGFEEQLSPVLRKHRITFVTYNTSLDRQGSKSEEMYNLLDQYGVSRVPALLIIESGKRQKLWLEPEKNLEEIGECMK